MKGYKTIITNVGVALFALLAMFGMEVGVEEQTAITAGILAVVNIVLRVMTTTPVGKKDAQ